MNKIFLPFALLKNFGYNMVTVYLIKQYKYLEQFHLIVMYEIDKRWVELYYILLYESSSAYYKNIKPMYSTRWYNHNSILGTRIFFILIRNRWAL